MLTRHIFCGGRELCGKDLSMDLLESRDFTSMLNSGASGFDLISASNQRVNSTAPKRSGMERKWTPAVSIQDLLHQNVPR